MKLIIYKKPVISAMLFNLFILFLNIYIYKFNYTYLNIYIMIFVGMLNGKILMNGENMNNKKRMLIIGSFLIMILLSFLYVYTAVIDKYSKVLLINV